MPRYSLVLAALVAGCATSAGKPPTVAAPAPTAAPPASPATAPPPAPAAVQLADEKQLETASGATYTLAKGWWVTAREGYTLLEDPERELSVALLELEAESGEAGIAASWQRFRPGFARQVFQTVKPPAVPPWDEIVQSVYDVPAQESRTVVGAARRAGKTWHVALIDGANAALGRRGAQMSTALNGYRPKGGQKESLAGRKAGPLDVAALDAFVERALAEARVPGAALVVLQGGKVAHERGYGVKEIGKPGAPTPGTRFLVGSITKSLTTFMMARLVDERRFGWDTKVTTLDPAFALGEPGATAKLEMRHTVCACTGLPRQDMEFLFEYAKVTPEQRVRSMAAMKPTTGFGETFQYSNTLVSTGGYLAARAADRSGGLEAAYERVMRTRMFAPLGMSSTTFDFAAAARSDHATPHGYDLGFHPAPLPIDVELGVRSVAPAGGAWSSARDLARWVQVELAKGTLPGGKRVVSEENLLARHRPMARISDKLTYGLGLMVEDDRGLEVVHHGGNTLGMTALAFWLPGQDVGAVMLTNASGANLVTGLVREKLFELWFGSSPRAEQRLAFGVKTRAEGVAKELERVVSPPDPAWMEARAGRWDNASLGTLEVRREGKDWIVDAGEWKATAAQYRDVNGELSIVLTSPPLAGLAFIPRPQDGKEVLLLETAQQKYAFERDR